MSCLGIKKNGKQCSLKGKYEGYCHNHKIESEKKENEKLENEFDKLDINKDDEVIRRDEKGIYYYKGNKYLLFYGHSKSIDKYGLPMYNKLSNFYKCDFSYTSKLGNVINFHCSEQAFILLKQMLFDENDSEAINNILSLKSPAEIKKIGRKTKNFNGEMWNEYREECMYLGLKLKFKNEPLKSLLLLSTEDAIIIESSPTDKIWGSGYSIEQMVNHKFKYKGLNLLGKSLMELRDEMRK